jgi:Methyltransferase domain
VSRRRLLSIKELGHRLIRRALDLLHRGEPWMANGAVAFCSRHLTRDMVGFEWGSGRSTIWFGRRLGRLVSIEHDPDWHASVARALQRLQLRDVDCRLIALDHDPREPTSPRYPARPGYVGAIDTVPNDSLDLVVVDGHYRQACAVAAQEKLRRGGWLLIDDAAWLPLHQWQIPADWPLVHASASTLRAKSTLIWQKP